VALYDVKARFDPLPEVEALRQAGLRAESTLVDLGAGTGLVSLAAARFCHHVIAVDVSGAMVEELKKRIETAPRNITVTQAGFLSYEHLGDGVDFVYTRNALHHLPDFWKASALVRIASMLQPRGVLRLRDLIFSCAPNEIDGVLDRWLDSVDEGRSGWTRAELEQHLTEEHSTYSWLLEPMITRAGFDIQDVVYSESRVFAAYTCIKRTSPRPS
jgi:SAM-dependent methyltransferase